MSALTWEQTWRDPIDLLARNRERSERLRRVFLALEEHARWNGWTTELLATRERVIDGIRGLVRERIPLTKQASRNLKARVAVRLSHHPVVKRV